jgi:hydroxymethylpyrimidine/phosphomethylpyrimidine kinase
MIPVALTIAGVDPVGGAGIAADLAVFRSYDVHGAVVVTAVTVQDTTRVHAIEPMPPHVVDAQLQAVLGDLPVRAAKTGMLVNAAIVESVAARLGATRDVALVVDPVLTATVGQTLSDPDLLDALRSRLLPLTTLVTPNLDEATALLGRTVADRATMRDAARALVDLGARAALVTGGHLPDRACDVLYVDGVVHELDAPRLTDERLHGTGCALSAAIAADLARGATIEAAVRTAKNAIATRIAHAVRLGRGSLLLRH